MLIFIPFHEPIIKTSNSSHNQRHHTNRTGLFFSSDHRACFLWGLQSTMDSPWSLRRLGAPGWRSRWSFWRRCGKYTVRMLSCSRCGWRLLWWRKGYRTCSSGWSSWWSARTHIRCLRRMWSRRDAPDGGPKSGKWEPGILSPNRLAQQRVAWTGSTEIISCKIS